MVIVHFSESAVGTEIQLPDGTFDRITEPGAVDVPESARVHLRVGKGVSLRSLANVPPELVASVSLLWSDADESFDTVLAWTNLERFTAGGSHMSDEHLAMLGTLPRLSSLQVWGNGCTDAGAIAFTDAALAHGVITQLYLEEEQVTDQVLPAVARLKTLETLGFQDAAIDGRGLAHLAALDRLTLLSLDGTQVDDEGLAQLPVLPSLQYLNLGGSRITDASVDVLLRQPGLLNVSVGERISPDGVARLREHGLIQERRQPPWGDGPPPGIPDGATNVMWTWTPGASPPESNA